MGSVNKDYTSSQALNMHAHVTHLNRRAGQNHSVAGWERFECLRYFCAGVLDLVALVQHDVVPSRRWVDGAIERMQMGTGTTGGFNHATNSRRAKCFRLRCDQAIGCDTNPPSHQQPTQGSGLGR